MNAPNKPKRAATRQDHDWVPAAVTEVARLLPPSEVAERLLTDARMKNVWTTLLRQKHIDQEAVFRHLFFDKTDVQAWYAEQRFSPQERAVAAFFVGVVSDLTRPLKPIKLADTKARAKPFFDAAKICREMISHAEGFQSGYAEGGEPLDFDLKKAFAIIADCLEYQGKDALAANDSHVIDRSARLRGDDKLRVKTRNVAATMFSIYGQRNYETTATVVTVATGEKISKKDVENWSENIPAFFEEKSQ